MLDQNTGNLPVIETRNLTKKFGDFAAVEELNIKVEQGEMYGFLGPNGAGKTTTLMILLGILKPTRGRVFLFNQQMQAAPFAIRRRIGVVLEGQNFYEDMSAWEYLLFFGKLYEVENSEQRARHLLERLNIWKFRNILVSGFSTGMLRKLAFARALIHQPDLLILDEPVSGLDPFGIVQFRELLLEEHDAGKTILISSHILSEIERTVDRVGIIAKGRLVSEGSVEMLRQKANGSMKIELDIIDMRPEIVDELRNLPFVSDVRLENEKVIVMISGNVDRRAELGRYLASMGVMLQGMRVLQTSLEDAFITLTESFVNQLTDQGSVERSGQI
jgi:ABC-2 type transport system ATP-binding protein